MVHHSQLENLHVFHQAVYYVFYFEDGCSKFSTVKKMQMHIPQQCFCSSVALFLAYDRKRTS